MSKEKKYRGKDLDEIWIDEARGYGKDDYDRRIHEIEEHYSRRTVKDRPCLHKGCSECHGGGIKRNGSICVHMISCPCPSCSPTLM